MVAAALASWSSVGIKSLNAPSLQPPENHPSTFLTSCPSSRPAPGPQVTCMHGLHLLNARQALREAHRILRPGGKLVVAWNVR